MKKPIPDLKLILQIVIPVGILVAAGFGFSMMKPQKPDSVPAAKEKSTFVRTIEVKRHSGVVTIPVSGVVVPHREIKVYAQVGGTITEKPEEIRAGKFVKEGDLLMHIEPKDYELKVEALKQQIAKADATMDKLKGKIGIAEQQVKQAKEEVVLQRSILDRRIRLHRSGSVSEEEVEEAKTKELTARKTLTDLEGKLQEHSDNIPELENDKKVLQEELKQAELDLARTTVTAPLSGVIVTDEIEQGSFIPQAQHAFTIEDTSAREVRCHLRMEELSWLWSASEEGMSKNPYALPSGVEADVLYRLRGRIYKWKGKLARYERVGLEDRARTIPCRVLVEKPLEAEAVGEEGEGTFEAPPALLRGMFVGVVFKVEPEKPLLSVPEAAVRPGNRMFLMRDGKLKILKDVQRARTAKGVVLLDPKMTGLQEGDKVIVSPLSEVREGLPVREQGTKGGAQ